MSSLALIARDQLQRSFGHGAVVDGELGQAGHFLREVPGAEVLGAGVGGFKLAPYNYKPFVVRVSALDPRRPDDQPVWGRRVSTLSTTTTLSLSCGYLHRRGRRHGGSGKDLAPPPPEKPVQVKTFPNWGQR